MRYNTSEENDGSLKISIEFGTTTEQKKLQTSFLSLLESIIYMQDIFTKQESIRVGDYKKQIIKKIPIEQKPVDTFYKKTNIESYQELQKLEEDFENNLGNEINELPNMDI